MIVFPATPEGNSHPPVLSPVLMKLLVAKIGLQADNRFAIPGLPSVEILVSETLSADNSQSW